MTAPNELIVDSRHLDVVKNKLKQLKVWAGTTQPEIDTVLDLALIKDLGGLTEFAVTTRKRYWSEISALERRRRREFTELDVLLYEVRNQLAAENGVVPLLGKNRDTLIGYPQHKGVGDPGIGVPIKRPTSAHPVEPEDRVLVGVVDTPLYRHPDFPEDRIDSDQYATPDRKGVYSLWSGHATAVAGRIWQCAPDARITVKAGLSDRTGEGTSWETARKMAAFAGSGIRVLNLSFGTPTEDGEPPLAMRRAIDVLRAADPDLLIVAAAGNLGHIARPPRQIWPAAMTGVIAVGATGAKFSMKEPWVDVNTVGLEVDTYYLDQPVRLSDSEVVNRRGFATWSGTSFAAAGVTGKIAQRLQTDPKATAAAKLKELLEDREEPLTVTYDSPF
ncbi:Uncharacterised protein [Amycolatopsis camponoti]|uniref:Peptidase S8/S53 domain-containing protein n=2 Tax=Amycolatopsis camponoti TaxID=2606593 RepID=A0A6I8M600_9PSEU|nr:Uncharacterised protein [Amycolatopsis camponoti]